MKKSYDIIRPSSSTEMESAIREGIGPHEAATLIGLPYYGDTPIRVWCRKVGEIPDRLPESAEFDRMVSILYSGITGAAVHFYGEEERFFVALKEKPWLRTSPASLLWPGGTTTEEMTPDNARIILCKTTSKAISRDHLPESWLLTAHYLMRVLGRESATIAWISYGGKFSFDFTEIRFDAERWSQVEARIDAFWKNYVVTGICPDDVRSNEDAMRLWSAAKRGDGVTADDDTAAACRRLLELKEQEDSIKAESEALRLRVRKALKEKDTLIDENGEEMATWKNVASPGSFQMERFREDHPQLYAMYLSPVSAQRRLIIKKKRASEAA